MSERKRFRSTPSEREIYEFINLWCDTTQTDTETFAKRLDWANPYNTDIFALAEAQFNIKPGNPPWGSVLEAVLSNSCESSFDYTNVLNPQITKRIIKPFIITALTTLQRDQQLKCFLAKHCITASIKRDLQRQLLKIITDSLDDADLTQYFLGIKYKVSFQALEAADLVKECLVQFPVLACSLSLTTYNWIIHISELLTRLLEDEIYLRDIACLPISVADLRSVRTGLSDPHNFGRTVAYLSFHDNQKLIYKPRDTHAEYGWQRLISWINMKSGLADLRAIRSFPRQGYGWAEYISPAPCKDNVELRRYYTRIGYLLALLYFLGGYDIHRENIIAAGEHPVVVDLETILSPTSNEWTYFRQLRTIDKYQLLLDDSVQRIGILPRRRISNDQTSQDISALALPPVANSSTSRYCQLTVPVSSLPFLGSQFVGPSRFVDLICSSFRDMFQFIVSNKMDLLDEEGPLKEFWGKEVRYVFRPTNTYISILREIGSSIYLRNGLARSIVLDALLVKDYLHKDSQPSIWQLIGSEFEALERLDIPLFQANSLNRSLILPDGRIIHCFFQESGFEALIRRFNSSDTNQQLNELIIRNALQNYS